MIDDIYGHTLAVSTDGSQFVYSTRDGLYLRYMDDLEAKLIPGTDKDDPQSPFFSPDAKWVGYWSQTDNELKKISIGGGAPQELCETTRIMGAIWHEDDTIIYSEVMSGIKRISANGGSPQRLVKGVTGHPQLLPDGESILYSDISISAPYKIIVQSLKTEKQYKLFPGYCIKYLPTGHIVYWLENTLYAVPFDPDTLMVTGEHVRVVEDVGHFIDISDSGALIYTPRTAGASEPQRTLVWVYKDGKKEPLKAPPNPYRAPKISPNGRYIAYMSGQTGQMAIIVRPFPEVDKNRWPVSTVPGESPVWSPDGRGLYYITPEKEIMVVPVNTEQPTFSHDKSRVLFQGNYVVGYAESPPYDIHPDGDRFLMIKPPETTDDESEFPNKIIIFINWFEELKELVPVP